jgi:hypothetical protein
MSTRCPYRPELDLATMPRSIKALPTDDRNYPVPWFVEWIDVDGKRVPEFRAMNASRWKRAIQQNLCWVCGEPKKAKDGHVFVAGPMCGINRTSAEPSCHPACARWSAKNCPFLARPHMVRREDEQINNDTLTEAAAGIALPRNPGVALVWFTPTFRVFADPNGKPLIEMGEPTLVEFYAEGRPATRAEVLASVESGYPLLADVAVTQPGGLAALRQVRERFERLVPA